MFLALRRSPGRGPEGPDVNPEAPDVNREAPDATLDTPLKAFFLMSLSTNIHIETAIKAVFGIYLLTDKSRLWRSFA